ncbi:MAG TPA: hypothetical protein VGW38_21205, partial [Chloroflexota bacterium]|nr:hypothetical protein [Chloroflexota bacterium]
NQPDALLRDQFQRVPPLRDLLRLGANYLIVDAISDVTRDGVYYDLAGTVALDPGQRAILDRFATSLPAAAEQRGITMSTAAESVAGPVTSVGLVTSLEGAARVSQGTPVASVMIGQTRGGQQRILWQGQLLAGRDTGEGIYSPAVQHAQPPPLGPAAATANASSAYLVRLPVPDVGLVDWIAVQNLLPAERGRVNVHAVTLVQAGGNAIPVTLAGSGSLRLVLKSDVKVYQVALALPRAYVTPSAVIVDDPAEALAVLGAPEHDPRGTVVLERAAEPEVGNGSFRRRVRRILDGLAGLLGISRDVQLGAVGGALEREIASSSGRASVFNGPQSIDAGSVEWLANTPERLALRVALDTPGFLVLRDTLYPGWSVRVDGEDAPLLRGDYLFRAVPLSAGIHQVEFTYRSLPFERGMVISLLALVATAVVALVPVPRWLREPGGA